MAEPVSWSSALIAKYGPTAIGLVIGTAAKYGLTLNEGKKLTVRGVVADMALLGILGVIAVIIGDVAGRIVGLPMSDNLRVLTGSLAAVSSDRLVRLWREAFLRRNESELAKLVQQSPATSAEVPAGSGQPAEIAIYPEVPDSGEARTRATLRSVYDRTTRQRPPADQIELLRRLDRTDTPT